MHMMIPRKDERYSGTTEYARIPSSEYANSFQNDHFVVPALLSMFS